MNAPAPILGPGRRDTALYQYLREERSLASLCTYTGSAELKAPWKLTDRVSLSMWHRI